MSDFLPLLFLGFGLGMVHALDADHIMAVSMLGNDRTAVQATFYRSAYWAAGHGFVLLLSGIALFGLGIVIPAGMQQLAEIGVGVLLTFLGIVCLYQLSTDRVKLGMHNHGTLKHAHWHNANHQAPDKSTHKPVLVGVLHGLAGSAPALALIPAVAHGHLSQAVLYLCLFSLGVAISMMLFGLGYGQLQRMLLSRYQRVFELSRQLMACLSIALGSYWLYQGV